MSKEKVNSLKDKDTEVSPNAEASLESDRELSPDDLDNVAGGRVKDGTLGENPKRPFPQYPPIS